MPSPGCLWNAWLPTGRPFHRPASDIDLFAFSAIRYSALLAHIERAGVELVRRPDAPE